MASDDELLEELITFRQSVEESLTKSEAQERAARQDRINVAVALGIVTTFVAISSSNQEMIPSLQCGWKYSDISCVLYYHAIAAAGYLPAKLAVMNFYPMSESKRLQFVNERFLPISYVFLLIGGSVAAFLLLLSIPIVFPWLVPLFFIGEAAIALPLGLKYSEKYTETMQEARAEISDEPLRPSGGSGEATRSLKIENTTPQDIGRNEIEISIESPTGVDVDIPNAISRGEGLFVFPYSIASGTRRDITLEIRKELAEKGDEPLHVKATYGDFVLIEKDISLDQF